jgi:hypothetical protein
LKRALVLVEGQTEEQFIKHLLGPHLETFDVAVIPTILVTKQVKSGPQFKGGVRRFSQIERDVRKLLRDSNAARVTTMFDLYGLPQDVPGAASVADRKGRERSRYLERALEEHFNSPRLRAFLMVHEFECIAFVDPAITARVLQSPLESIHLQEERDEFDTAEDVNDGANTHPSQRILDRFTQYRKPLHGPVIARSVGLERIRESCPHLSEWISDLEQLGRRSG